MLRAAAFALSALTALAACTPIPPSSSGTGMSGGPTPNCGFAPSQTSNDLRMNCTISGGLPNTLIDPLHPGSSSCGNNSVSLFGQTIGATIAVIYGENGDENSDRVRLGAMVSNGTHRGSLAKAAGRRCDQTVWPTVPVNTSFTGRHIALIDKSQTPACVFQSRMTFASFTQTIGAGLTLPVGPVTRSTVEDEVGKRLDLAMATAVNGLLQPNANTGEPGFVGRSGRCANGYQAFTGN